MTSLPIITLERNGKPAIPSASVAFSARAGELRAAGAIETLQVNVGKLCNQACKHCHVDASPARTEIISREVVDACLDAITRHAIPVLDITGGAPELVPDFRYLVVEAKRRGVSKVMVRHNLTVMFEEGQEDLPGFFAANGVEVVSSLPYFQAGETDAQRGGGVFDKSIAAIRRLNEAGYGRGGGLVLNLVYNPVGAFLPPAQSAIEADFKRELAARHGVTFDNLFAITNMPIARFLDWLRRSRNEEAYMRKLVGAFNPATLGGLMCRSMVSVDWTGRLYDCDFNQMLELEVAAPPSSRTIFDFDARLLAERPIATADHCYGCTAGSGSSCGGSVEAD